MKGSEQRCAVRIGTSGWHYKHWLGPFYPANLRPKDMLAWYMERFDTVELNNSFYHLPARETFEAWRRATPASFCFAVKGSRYITHRKKLNDPAPALARFMEPVESLGDKLGPILFQLPPRWTCNVPRLTLSWTRCRRVTGIRSNFAIRVGTIPSVYRALGRHNVAFCLYELDGFETPYQLTADFVYVRLHGPGRKYQGDYSSQQLRAWARRIARWRQRFKAVYVYFDNDQAGYAAKNAAELKSLTQLMHCGMMRP